MKCWLQCKGQIDLDLLGAGSNPRRSILRTRLLVMDDSEPLKHRRSVSLPVPGRFITWLMHCLYKLTRKESLWSIFAGLILAAAVNAVALYWLRYVG